MAVTFIRQKARAAGGTDNDTRNETTVRHMIISLQRVDQDVYYV